MGRRIRTIKPEFWTSEDVAALSREARLTFLGLLTYGDDYGIGNAKPALIKAAVWPLDDDITRGDVEGHLLELIAREMVELFTVEGREYVSIVNWHKHQAVSNKGVRFTPMSPQETLRRLSGESPESLVGEGKGGEGESDGESGWDAGHRLTGEGTARESPELPPSPFCKKHPESTDEPCRPCGNARRKHDVWVAQRMQRDG